MENKLFVLVGAGPGLGNAIAREFGQHDFRLVLIARNAERLAHYREALTAEGYEVYTKVGDAARPETLTHALDDITETLGTPDAYVYHVGNTTPDPEEITNELLLSRYQVDVASAYVTAMHLANNPRFAERHGAILFTGGGFAKTFATIPFLKPLCIDKAALNAANIVLHDTLAPRGIFVGSVLVSGVIRPGDEKYDPALIAKVYWQMYAERTEFQVQY